MNEYWAAFICLCFACVIFIAVACLPGCATSNRPNLDIDLWAADSANQRITRSQKEGSSISCQDQKFDDYMCLSYSDFIKLMDLIGSCKEWES